MKTSTMTKTKSVTNTQLGIATAVLLGVSALAFLVIPALTDNTTPTYRYASWECQDGSKQDSGTATACISQASWFITIQQACNGRCNYANICGLKTYALSQPCQISSCVGVNQPVYGTAKCCAGLVNTNGYCTAPTTCTSIDQQVYGTSRCCAGLVNLKGTCRNPNCIDLDGKNYFTSTDITNYRGNVIAKDKCAIKNFLGRYTIVAKGTFVAERICNKGGLDTIYYKCPKGCVNGACVK